MLEIAEGVDNQQGGQFSAIHSKNDNVEGAAKDLIGRVCLQIDPKHVQEIRQHQEEKRLVDEGTKAAILAAGGQTNLSNLCKQFTDIISSQAQELLPQYPTAKEPFTEVEIIKSSVNSPGQERHMDCWTNTLAATVCLQGAGSTIICNHPYVGFPENLEDDTTLGDWNEMATYDIRWSKGDAIILPANMIHAGPPNHSNDTRYAAFATQVRDHGMEFSDTSVIFNDVFKNWHEVQTQHRHKNIRCRDILSNQQ